MTAQSTKMRWKQTPPAGEVKGEAATHKTTTPGGDQGATQWRLHQQTRKRATRRDAETNKAQVSPQQIIILKMNRQERKLVKLRVQASAKVYKDFSVPLI